MHEELGKITVQIAKAVKAVQQAQQILHVLQQKAAELIKKIEEDAD